MRRSKSATILEQAADQAGQVLAQAKEQAVDLAERIAPVAQDAKEKLVEQAGELAERIAPAAADAREKVAEKVGPTAADAKARAAGVAALATAKAAEVAADAKTRTAETLPDSVVDTSDSSGRSRTVKVLTFLGLGTAAVFVAKKIKDRRTPQWHTAPVGVPTMPAQNQAQNQAQSQAQADDASGASPDEAAADQAEHPHRATTPDNPAETVVLED